MPDDLVIIRHGESEANVLHGLMEEGQKRDVGLEFRDKYHDSAVRLSEEGAKQAQAAGEWLKQHGFDSFDRYYVSPFIRTRETAGNLGLGGEWRVDDRLREQDWGEYNLLSWEDIESVSPYSFKLARQNYLYWRPKSGESLASEVRARLESYLTTLHRRCSEQKVVVVSHGGWMRAARLVLERRLPDEFQAEMVRGELGYHNCLILHYSRKHPETGEQADYLRWFRAICPWDESKSWHEGAWQEIPLQTFSDQELLESAEKYPRSF